MRIIRVQSQNFDAGVEATALSRGRTDVGALVTFTGICRGEDALTALDLEHYPGMAEAEIARVAEQAEARWPLAGLIVVHRIGRIAPGDNIMFVATASAHRAAAFEAASFLMDFLKTRAPFWKRELRADGAGGWVAAKQADDAAACRWNAEPESRL